MLAHATQRHRLLGQLATCFAFHFTGTKVLDMARELRSQVHETEQNKNEEKKEKRNTIKQNQIRNTSQVLNTTCAN